MSNSEDETVDGARVAAQILMRLPPEAQERIVEAMGENAPEVLRKVQEKMVTLEDLTRLTPQSIQILLREIDHKDVIAVLNSASEEVKEAVYQSIPQGARKIIEEDLAHTRGMSPLEVQGAQSRIVVKLDELKEQGRIREGDAVPEKKGRWA